MKRLVALVMVLMLISGTNVFAYEVRTEYKQPGFPESFVPEKVSLFSDDDDLEEALVKGWETFAEKIDVSDFGMNINDIGNKYWQILYKNPLFYYVSGGFKYSYYPNGKVTSVYPIYTESDKASVKNTIDEINKATDEILLYVNGNMSDFDKVMAVHDYMALNYEYDHTLKNHSITIMTTKTGVCESYARAFYHIMDKLGIDCGFVTSESMNHAWNIVELDGKWYHIDLTWDDPTYNGADAFAQVTHEYALLSDEKIKTIISPHYGYDLGELSASSKLYDNAPWRGRGSIVFSNGVSYYIKGTSLVSSRGEIIYNGLDGNDGGWDLDSTSYYPSAVFANIAEYNGKIYFNTDTALYSYNPKTKQKEKLLSKTALAGLYIDKNTLRYSRISPSNGQIQEAGSINLGDIRYGEPYYDDDELIIKIYKETSEPMMVFTSEVAKNGKAMSIQSSKLEEKGLYEVEFDKKNQEQEVFYWDENLKPLKNLDVVKK